MQNDALNKIRKEVIELQREVVKQIKQNNECDSIKGKSEWENKQIQIGLNSIDDDDKLTGYAAVIKAEKNTKKGLTSHVTKISDNKYTVNKIAKENFPELDSIIKDLIVKGYYTLYKAIDNNKTAYIISTDENLYFLISETGTVLKQLENIDNYILKKAIYLPEQNISYPIKVEL